uniref:Uncharacterized protein n=1 Tax=Parascaris equorum TaxID=6256 RepID=A0A914R8N7_PAREQ
MATSTWTASRRELSSLIFTVRGEGPKGEKVRIVHHRNSVLFSEAQVQGERVKSRRPQKELIARALNQCHICITK